MDVDRIEHIWNFIESTFDNTFCIILEDTKVSTIENLTEKTIEGIIEEIIRKQPKKFLNFIF